MPVGISILTLLIGFLFSSSEKYSIYYESPKEDYKSYNDTSFVAGDSPITLNVFTDLGRYTYNGEINCDSGSIYVQLSSDGVSYNDTIIVNIKI